MVEQTDIRVVRCGGSKICFSTPILTNDSRFLICASGDSVKVFSTRTEECVHVLHGHANQVTGVALNPANHLQVYSCSLDGTVRLWDFIDGILIKVGLCLCACAEHFQLVAVRLPSALEQELEARELSAVLSDVSPVPACTAFGQGVSPAPLALSAEPQFSCLIFVCFRFKLKATDKKGARNAFTCVACHPKDDCIATGHQDGKIRLWRNFNQKKEYTYSTQHWHHNAVSALCFSPEGMHLLSGGVESVLVQWHCKEVNKKNFLPRLGGAIAHICVSPDGQMYSTSHTNNKITIISSFRVSAVIQGLVKGGSVQTDLMIDPRTKALVLNGKPGHLQFYSLERDKQLYSLDIVQQEYIYQAGLDQFEVVKAALDGTASWLATVEQRGSKISSLEFSLKLWSFNEKAQSFELNTTITAPHQNMITAMCFSPAMDTTMLVTVAKDDQFKVWLLGSDLDEQKKQASWSCEHLGSYHGLQPTNCCFSGDGSLLAVSFAEVVTLWSPDTWELLTTLCQPPGTIEDLCFGRLSCSKYLLGTTTKNLLCWNLLTCALEWSTSMDVCVLRTDPLSENVAAFCHNSGKTDLFVFRPSEPRPLFTQKAVCVGRVQRCIFVPREDPLDSCDEWSQWLNRSRLHFLTEQMELLTFSTRAEDERILNSRKELLVDDSVAMTPFYLLLGKHRQQQQEKQTSVPSQAADRAQLPQGCVAIRELLHTPAHVLPPASFLCSVFLNSLLISNTVDSEKEEVDSEEEMEMNNGPQGVRTQGSVGEAPPSLSRAEEKELRRLRKTDFSWVTSLTSS
uniref:WD repeat-containing protein 75 second beta-propeller domain-containing protein n=1 Tax=Electrophorus electricus TaxID=8005 RepID=A0A4W4HH52_ELEEL